MSILDSLLRFVDPIAHRERQEERRRKRDAIPPEVDADDVEPVVPPLPGRRPVTLTCRVCGYAAETDHRFCPRCLAETMARRR